MSRRPARCTQAEIARAIKAAGPGMVVEILPDGTIRISPYTVALAPTLPPVGPKVRNVL